MKRDKYVHFAWSVLLACCAIQAGALGAISNCKGVFFDAVCSDLGMSLGTFTLQGVFAGVVSAALTPLALRLLKSTPMHKTLFAACIGYTGTQFLMSYLSGSALLWDLVACVQAAAGAFLLFLPVPIILNRWFVKKRGLAMSIAAVFSGLSSMVLNPVYASVIAHYGWRTAYRFVGLLSFAVMAPFLLFVLRGTPEEKGVRAYGADTGPSEVEAVLRSKGVTHGGAKLMMPILSMAVCISFCSCFQSHLTKYGITLGRSLQISAFLPSVAMLGSVLFKPAMGILADRLGTMRTAIGVFLLNLLGFVLLAFSGESVFCLCLGSFLCGVSMATNVVLLPLLVGTAMHGYDFDRYYSYLSMTISLTGVSASAVFGYLFDWTGSYFAGFLVLIAMAALCIVALLVLRRTMQTKRM